MREKWLAIIAPRTGFGNVIEKRFRVERLYIEIRTTDIEQKYPRDF